MNEATGFEAKTITGLLEVDPKGAVSGGYREPARLRSAQLRRDPMV